jgi:hypothetical protein
MSSPTPPEIIVPPRSAEVFTIVFYHAHFRELAG